MNEDFLDFLRALVGERVRFLLVGAHALSVHGVPRATGDLDVWIDVEADNVSRVWSALRAFGAPMEELGITLNDLARPDTVVQFGLPPRRIDVLTGLTGLDFESAWNGRDIRAIEGMQIAFLGRGALIENKRATGRLKDLADLEALGESPEPSESP